MALPAEDDVIKLRLLCHFDGQLGQNIRYYQVIGVEPPGATTQEIADFLSTAFHLVYKALISQDAEWVGTGVQNFFPGAPDNEVFGLDDRGPGDDMGAALPKQTAGVITLRSDMAGRANRGRMYLPFPSETSNDGFGKPTVPYLNDLQALADGMVSQRLVPSAGAGETVLQPIIWSSLQQLPGPFVTSAVARNIWGTQRRRGDYGAPNPIPQ